MKLFLAYIFFSLLVTANVQAQTTNDIARQLLRQAPTSVIDIEKNIRESLITSESPNLLMLTKPDRVTFEWKLLSQSQDRITVGVSRYDCAESSLRFWTVKKGAWKEVTDKVIKPLGKDDVFAILRASPVVVHSLNSPVDVSYFYTFNTDSALLTLFARKQNGCEVAGTVYTYEYNGQRFKIK